jgi:tRNA A-37 threonylcarbamoyl transferase component Bud32
MSVELIRQIHHGRNNIYIINYNGNVCILKRPKDNSHDRTESLKKQLKRIKFWKKYGLSTIKSIEYHNGIIKTYIEGNTLKEFIDKNKHFFSEKSVELKALKRFVKLLVKSRHFIHDMKSLNIVLNNDNRKFEIIDSGPIYKRSYKSSLKKEYQKILYTKWSKLLDSNKERKYLKKFLKMR